MVTYREYRVVDVFTERVMEGNSLAVFLDGSGLDPVIMQKIARELNLAETVFLLPATRSDCAARLRIFTPMRELPFAGHPTLGAAYVLREEQVVPKQTLRFLLEEEAGPVPIRVEAGPLFWLTTPVIEVGPTRDRALCAAALGLPAGHLLPIDPQILNAGNPTLLVGLQDRAAVDQAWLEREGLRQLRGDYLLPICVFVFAPVPEGAYSRMFAPEYGIAEDPATGSSTGPLAHYMLRHGLLPEALRTRFVSEQGVQMGRRSVLHVQADPERAVYEIGGHVTPFARGVMHLPQD